ncbi:ATP-binding protein [Methanolobus profundi]|uniref:Magnesium chelatase subunit I n=1 Tax=Methanolobus profundi TaxID=487685 RepID=A0A1I4QWJ6_9EURY|nr:ATP-binding protein [Methanolobus profundi]SFM44066.1 magnesium chelatase subunit I [Methanolobus profundi]
MSSSITGTIKEVPKAAEEPSQYLEEIARKATRTDRVLYPISAIVGQEKMLRALILNTINPSIGGVLIRGQKGTAKSTAVRGLAEVLPEIEIIDGCKFNCNPDDPEKFCWECMEKKRNGTLHISKRQMKVVDLPVGATEDRVVGSLDIEKAVRQGVQAFDPGILAQANRGILYVDEINLLDDFVVDALLDAAAMNVNTVEREGVSVSHPADFIIVGSMNPEEGELRPQLLDRIALQVEVTGIYDVEQRIEIVERRNQFNDDPKQFIRDYEPEQEKLRSKIIKAMQLLPRVSTTRENLRTIAEICIAFNVDGHRADIMIERAARTNAAYEGRERITNDDIIEASEMVLPHRMRKKPFEEEEFSVDQLRAVVDGKV